MVPSRPKKFRGKRTHGRGKKAGRGAGKRGGRGLAGLHKHKWSYTVKFMPDHFGRHGFKRPQKVVGARLTINVNDVEQNLDKFIENGIGKKGKGGIIEIDLKKIGFDKLLGKGKITKKMKIIVPQASQTAISKIEELGGKVEVEKPSKKEDVASE
jgi:large subunit ribosomal protein L15